MYVMDSPALRAQRVVGTVEYPKSFATWQHRFDVDSNFLRTMLVPSTSKDTAIVTMECV